MSGLFALVDMDASYVSAEAVSNPRLRGKPVCVLSNGDGNVVARSREAKALGIAMGQPAFQLRDLVRSNGLILQQKPKQVLPTRAHSINRCSEKSRRINRKQSTSSHLKRLVAATAQFDCVRESLRNAIGVVFV